MSSSLPTYQWRNKDLNEDVTSGDITLRGIFSRRENVLIANAHRLNYPMHSLVKRAGEVFQLELRPCFVPLRSRATRTPCRLESQ